MLKHPITTLLIFCSFILFLGMKSEGCGKKKADETSQTEDVRTNPEMEQQQEEPNVTDEQTDEDQMDEESAPSDEEYDSEEPESEQTDESTLDERL